MPKDELLSACAADSVFFKKNHQVFDKTVGQCLNMKEGQDVELSEKILEVCQSSMCRILHVEFYVEFCRILHVEFWGILHVEFPTNL